MVNRNRQKREIRKKVWEKCDKKCFYCRVEMVFKGRQNGKFMTMEHLIPKSQGGTLAEDNVVAACKACNEARGTMKIKDFVEFMEAKRMKEKEKERAEMLVALSNLFLAPSIKEYLTAKGYGEELSKYEQIINECNKNKEQKK